MEISKKGVPSSMESVLLLIEIEFRLVQTFPRKKSDMNKIYFELATIILDMYCKCILKILVICIISNMKTMHTSSIKVKTSLLNATNQMNNFV